MRFRDMCGQVFTGRDNVTIAWGRVMGGLVFVLLILAGIPVGVVLVAIKRISAADLVQILGALSTYVPAICFGAAALVAGSAFSEPRPRDPT